MKICEIESAAKQNYLPIIRPQTLQRLLQTLKQNNCTKILEVGSFYGYSATKMLQQNDSATLVTIEKLPQNALVAEQTFKDEKVAERAEIICEDAQIALKKLCLQNKKFDFVFLDGPKGQYIKHLPLIKSMLEKGGVIFADDVLFHGYVKQDIVKHKHRTIVNNLKKFISQIQNDKDFESQLFEIEDGFLIAKKIK